MEPRLKSRKSQMLSVFIIIALFLLLSFSILYYFVYRTNPDESGNAILEDMVLSSQANTVSSLVQDCLEKQTDYAITQFCGAYSTSEQCIEEYVKYYFDDCFNPAELQDKRITIVAGEITTEARVTADTVVMYLEYPLKIKHNLRTYELRTFTYVMPIKSQLPLSLDADQKTSEEIRVISYDRQAELVIPAGTKIYSEKGPVSQLSLRIADKHEGGLVNSVVMGMTVYDGEPSGVRFEPAVTIRIKYLPEQIRGIPESELKLGWYDENIGIWKGLPSSEVDQVNKIVSAKISHFTKIGAVACTSPDGEVNDITFRFKNIIKTIPEELAQGDDAQTTANTTEAEVAAQESTETDPSAQPEEVPADEVDPMPDIEEEQAAQSNVIGAVPNPSSPTDLLMEPQTCSCVFETACTIQDSQELEEQHKESFGFFNFTIPEGGTACIMESEGSDEAEVAVEIMCSEGDTCGDQDPAEDYKQEYVDLTDKVVFNPLPIPGKWEDGGLVIGPNFIYIKMEDTNKDGCVWADAKVTIKGRGIIYPEQGEISVPGGTTPISTGGCTVQDAINTLCGKGDPVYNDAYPGVPNCEKDSKGNAIGFLDPNREPTLNSLLSSAQSVNPSSWRGLPLDQVPIKDQVTQDIQSLGLNLICGSSGVTSGYACRQESTPTSSPSMMGGTLSSDPEVNSKSTMCTSWEKSRTREDIIQIIRIKARELGSQAGITDLATFESYMIGIAMQESSITPCRDGSVITGDGGDSIGLMQVPNKDCANGLSVYRLECNIEMGIRHFLEKQSSCSSPEKFVLSSQTTAKRSDGSTPTCGGSSRQYPGFDCGLRRYNGWICCDSQEDPLDCGGYVKKIHQHMTNLGLSVSTGSITAQTTGQTSSVTSTVSSTTSSSTYPTTYSSDGVVCTMTTMTDTYVNDCQAGGGQLVDSMATCSNNGGWPIAYTSSSSSTGICCKTQGCCVSSGGSYADSTESQCIGTVVSASSSSDGGTCGNEIVEIAKSALGRPYVLGAPSWNEKSIPPESSAVDCSSFTQWVFNRYAYLKGDSSFYIQNRLAGWQARNIGRVVDHDPLKDQDNYQAVFPDCSKLQPGDLLFFYNTDDVLQISHVGIYIGDCKMIHAGAPEPTDPTFDDWTNLDTHKVQIVSLNSDTRKEHYIGAKRVCPDVSAPKVLAAPAPVSTKTFLETSCSDIKGCCTWSSGSKCAKDVSKSTCATKSGTAFTAFDTQCSKYPGCSVQTISLTNSIVQYAQQYLGCPYSWNPTGLWAPSQCRAGLTCATFVSSVFSHVCGVTIYGHGGQKCQSGDVNYLGSDVSVLQPGDIFAYGRVDGVTLFGHTGIFVGRDNDGRYQFIHSYPGTGVSYVTYEWVKANGPDVRFCRVKSCSNIKTLTT